jgi:hypothetical protein
VAGRRPRDLGAPARDEIGSSARTHRSRDHPQFTRLGYTHRWGTVWNEGKKAAFPKAEAVIFVGGSEVALGFAPWESVQRALSGSSRATPKPDYPTRYVVTDFPEDWQMGMLDLKPWGGPLPV